MEAKYSENANDQFCKGSVNNFLNIFVYLLKIHQSIFMFLVQKNPIINLKFDSVKLFKIIKFYIIL